MSESKGFSGHRLPQREPHRKMGVMLPQAKEPRETGREAWNRPFPSSPAGTVLSDLSVQNGSQ